MIVLDQDLAVAPQTIQDVHTEPFDLTAGTAVSVSAAGQIESGVVFTGSTPPTGWEGPARLAGPDDRDWPYHGRQDSFRYALIGAFAADGGVAPAWFYIGASRTVTEFGSLAGQRVRLRFAVNRPHPDQTAAGRGQWNVTVRVTAPVAGDQPAVQRQDDWQWCPKCQGLFFAGGPSWGRCPAGGEHDHAGSGTYELAMGGPGQGDWRWCHRCQGLFFHGADSFGACPEGGEHARDALAQSASYVLAGEGAGQAGWRRCAKCEGLFFADGGSVGRCPAGGEHDGSRSDDYHLTTLGWPVGSSSRAEIQARLEAQRRRQSGFYLQQPNGNFELVIADDSANAERAISHLWRDPRNADRWWNDGALNFGAGRSASLIWSSFGYTEVVAKLARTGAAGHFFAHGALGWQGPTQLGDDRLDQSVRVKHQPAFIQVDDETGHAGAFHVVAPRRNGRGFAHFVRDNRPLVTAPWQDLGGFGSDDLRGLALMQGRSGNLELLAVFEDGRLGFFSCEGTTGPWRGPEVIGAGAAGRPAMIQSRYGRWGNFEAVVPRAEGGLDFYFREMDLEGFPWRGPFVIGDTGTSVREVSFFQNVETDELELVALEDNAMAFYRRDGEPPFTWRGPERPDRRYHHPQHDHELDNPPRTLLPVGWREVQRSRNPWSVHLVWQVLPNHANLVDHFEVFRGADILGSFNDYSYTDVAIPQIGRRYTYRVQAVIRRQYLDDWVGGSTEPRSTYIGEARPVDIHLAPIQLGSNLAGATLSWTSTNGEFFDIIRNGNQVGQTDRRNRYYEDLIPGHYCYIVRAQPAADRADEFVSAVSNTECVDVQATTPPPRPTAADLGFAQEPILTSPEGRLPFRAGSTITAAWSVGNFGTTGSPACHVLVVLFQRAEGPGSEQEIGRQEFAVPPLAAGAQHSLSCQFRDIRAGDYRAQFILDSQGEVADPIRINNMTWNGFEVE